MQFFALPLARILLSLVFIFAGYAKVIGFDPMNMAEWIKNVQNLKIPGTADPLPSAELLAQISGWAELVGGVMLFLGVISRITAFGLFLFTIAASVLAHNFWTISTGTPPDPAAVQMLYNQILAFLKNMGIAGGLLLIVVAGGGMIGIDGMFRRQH